MAERIALPHYKQLDNFIAELVIYEDIEEK